MHPTCARIHALLALLQPNCDLKLDDPLRDEPELISKLLDVNAAELGEVTDPPRPAAKARRARLKVRVLERRSVPAPAASTAAPAGSASSVTGCRCELPSDLVLLYKLCVALCVFFALGCCCNLLFCCLNNAAGPGRRPKRPVPKTLGRASLSSNQYWIADSALAKHRAFGECAAPAPDPSDEFPSQYSELAPPPPVQTLDQLVQKRSSLGSYASLRPRHARADGPEAVRASAPAQRTFHSPASSKESASPRDSLERPAPLLTLSDSTAGGQKETYSIL